MSDQPEQHAVPAGEELHLPGPSLIPIVNAFGLALFFIGLSISLFSIIVGLIIFVWSLIHWIRATAREINELPLEHLNS